MAELLPGSVETSAARLGFDTTTRLSSTTASQFRESGFTFCIRYISRDDFVSTEVGGHGSLTRAEAEDILGAGLALMPVQYGQKGLVPTAALGTTVGTHAGSNATALGFPPGCSVWCDVESVAEDTTTEAVVEYCNAWSAAVSTAGFTPGLYVGPASKLTTDVLYKALHFTSYWKSASRVGNVDTRGYQMLQSLSQTLNGVRVDLNIAAIDSKGGRPRWLAPPSEDAAHATFVTRRLV